MEPKPAHPIPIWLGTFGNRALQVTGSPAAVTETLLGLARAGFTAFSFTIPGPGAGEQAERLAREVIPAVRAAV